MLKLTRRAGESLIIRPSKSLDPDMTVGELFSNGPLTVTIMRLHGHQIRIGVSAPDALNVIRSELLVPVRQN